MTRNVIGWILSTAAVAGFAYWRVHAPADLPLTHYAVADRSGSDTSSCAALGRVVGRALAAASSSPPAGSHWYFFATGSADSAFEPIGVPVQSLPALRRLIDGREKSEEQNAAFVGEVVRACTTIPPSDKSPIYLGLKRVIAQARQNGRPQVYAVTDLEEMAEPQIVAALGARLGAKSALPPKIDNAGVPVHICGYAETKGVRPDDRSKRLTPPRTGERADRLVEVWRSLFSHPDLVTFEPFCL